MTIILPNRIDGLPDLEAKLSTSTSSGLFDSIDQLLVDHKLNVALPKFKIEATLPNMKELLIQFGIKDLFDGSLADLSGISGEKSKNLYVSDVFHKCFIEVNEEGSEASGIPKFSNFIILRFIIIKLFFDVTPSYLIC